MSDIVERLLWHATDWNGAPMPDDEPAKGDPTAGTLREAVDEIERLRYRLREIVGCYDEWTLLRVTSLEKRLGQAIRDGAGIVAEPDRAAKSGREETVDAEQ